MAELSPQQLQDFANLSPAAQDAFRNSTTSAQFTNVPAQTPPSQQTQNQPSYGDISPYQSTGNPAEDLGVSSLDAIINTPTNAFHNTVGLGSSLLNIFNPNLSKNTLVNLSKLAVGGTVAAADKVSTALGGKTFSQLTQGVLPDSIRNWVTGDVNNASNLVQYFKQRYGGYQNILKSFANDPTGVALDMSMLLDGAGALTQAAGTSADVAKAGQIADEGGSIADMANANGASGLSRAGAAISKAGEFINPITAPFRAAGSAISAIGARAGQFMDAGQDFNDVRGAVSRLAGQGEDIQPTGGMLTSDWWKKAAESMSAKTMFGGQMIKMTKAAIQSIDTGASSIAAKASDILDNSGFLDSTDAMNSVKNAVQAMKDTYNKVLGSVSDMFKTTSNGAIDNGVSELTGEGGAADTLKATQGAVTDTAKDIRTGMQADYSGFEQDETVQNAPTAANNTQSTIQSILKRTSKDLTPAGKATTNFMQSLSDSLTAGTTVDGTPVADAIPGWDSMTDSQKQLAIGQLEAKGSEVADSQATFGNLWQTAKSLGEKLDASGSTIAQNYIAKIKAAMNADMQEVLGGLGKTQDFNDMQSAYGNLKAGLEGGTVTAFLKSSVDDLIKKFTSGSPLAKVGKAEGVAETSLIDNLGSLKSSLTDGQFGSIGDAVIKRMWEKTGDFSAFNTAVGKIPDEVWQALLSPDKLAGLQKIQSLADSFSEVAEKSVH